MKNEIEKQQRDGDNTAANEDKTIKSSSDEPSNGTAVDNETALSNGVDTVNQQQSAAKLVAC